MIIALILSPLNVLLVIVGIYTPLKGSAIGLATAVTQSINAICLIIILRKMWGPMGLTRVAISLVKILIATGVLTLSVLAVLHYLPDIAQQLAGMFVSSTTTWLSDTIVLSSAVLAGSISYLGMARLLNSQELRDILRRGQQAG